MHFDTKDFNMETLTDTLDALNAGQDLPAPSVCIVVPVLNEEHFLKGAIESIAPDPSEIACEILIIDGGSTDGTKIVANCLMNGDPRIRFIHNEKRLQSAAVNLGVRIANPAARVFIRADSHAIYPPHFVKICAEKLRESGAQSLVVTMNTLGEHGFQAAVAAAQNSIIGNGGSAHRRQGISRYIDHGHHAAFDKDFFERLGGYDESVKANEDVDLDMRIAKTGGRIWLETSIPIIYFPRDTIGGLFRQYYNYGKGRALTFSRYHYPLKFRQLMPVVSLMTVLLGTLLSFFWWPFLLLPASYVLLCLCWGLASAILERRSCLMFLGLAAITMHQAWAVGFLKEMATTRRIHSFTKALSVRAKNFSDRTETQKS